MKGSSRSDCFAVALMSLGLWFLLREIEIVALLEKHFQLDTEAQTITMTLWASKTDQVGNLVSRSVGGTGSGWAWQYSRLSLAHAALYHSSLLVECDSLTGLLV